MQYRSRVRRPQDHFRRLLILNRVKSAILLPIPSTYLAIPGTAPDPFMASLAVTDNALPPLVLAGQLA